mmetsp:Transcript_115964/g.237111  ORF Transcript_115964/g.237111 Transcript_115964/m.237111 type:complete len:244 (+) Transcript_115964:1546-2277(+)
MRFCFHEALVVLDSSLLRSSSLGEALVHLIAHLLQDPDDFPTLGHIAGAVMSALKEGEDVLAVIAGHVLLCLQEPLQDLCGIRLQETGRHALLQCCNSLHQGADVGVSFALLRCIGGRLLLPDACGLCHGRLRRLTIRLRCLKLLRSLRMERLGLLDLCGQGGRLGLCRRDAGLEVAPGVLAIAHELLIEFLLLLAFLRNLRLHRLQHRHHLPDGVGSGKRSFLLFNRPRDQGHDEEEGGEAR